MDCAGDLPEVNVVLDRDRDFGNDVPGVVGDDRGAEDLAGAFFACCTRSDTRRMESER